MSSKFFSFHRACCVLTVTQTEMLYRAGYIHTEDEDPSSALTSEDHDWHLTGKILFHSMTCRAQSREALPSSILRLRKTNLMQCRTAGKVGTPGDVANLCTFLADPVKASFITGQEFVLDGGVTRKMIYPEWSLSHQALLCSMPVLHRPMAALTCIKGIWHVDKYRKTVPDWVLIYRAIIMITVSALW